MPNKLMNYFNKAPRLGTLSTAAKDGTVDSAVFGSPRMTDPKTVVMGLARNRSFQNIQENPHAVFLIMEPGKALTDWKGVRVYLKKKGLAVGGPDLENYRKQIAQAVDVPIQFGGGVRSVSLIEDLLNAGISRVILGTKAVEDKSFLDKIFKKFKDKVIVSIDSKSDRVLTQGWQASAGKTDVLKFAHSLKEAGFKEVIYTDVLKDGTLKGPNIKAIKSLLKETGMEVIASGGISSLADLQKLKLLEKKGVTGVIIGKALYEGKFTLAEALKFS